MLADTMTTTKYTKETDKQPTLMPKHTSTATNPQTNDQNLVNIDINTMTLEPLNDADDDDALIQFLNTFETNQTQEIVQKPNTVHNIQNIQQNVSTPRNFEGMMPKMFFPNSTVTINYNFGK